MQKYVANLVASLVRGLEPPSKELTAGSSTTIIPSLEDYTRLVFMVDHTLFTYLSCLSSEEAF